MSSFILNLSPLVLKLAVALGIGLLIGAERERRKGEGPSRAPAGIRTFSITSLAGAISLMAGGELLFAVTTVGVIALTGLAYLRARGDDPGLTTEIALIVTVILGGLSTREPALAAGVAVAVAILLAARTPMHHFVRSVLTEEEVRHALVFAGATLVVLPLLPDRRMGPYGVLNPHSIWIIVILVMAISAAGYAAVRLLGARFGLPIAGFASGFISSIATISAMGTRVAQAPNILKAAVAGAVLSTVATICQMAAVLGMTSVLTLQTLSVPLISAGVTAAAYGAVFTFGALQERTEVEPQQGRAFSLLTAAEFALILSGILIGSEVLRGWFGETGVILIAAVAGFVDTHSPAISVASLVAAGKINAADSVIPILVAFSTNTISKMIFARTSGGASYALRVIPGLGLVAAAAWAGAFHLLVSS